MLVETEAKVKFTGDNSDIIQKIEDIKKEQASLEQARAFSNPYAEQATQIQRNENTQLEEFKQVFKQVALSSTELGGKGYSETPIAQNKDLTNQTLPLSATAKTEKPVVTGTTEPPKISSNPYAEQATQIQRNESQKNSGILAKISEAIFHTEKKKEIEKIDIRLEMLSKTMDELNDQLKKATERGDDKGKEATSITIANTQTEIDSLRARRNELTAKDDNDAAEAIRQYGLMKALQQGLGLATQIDNIGFNKRKAFASGDYLGAEVQEKQGWAGVFGSLGDVSLGLTPVLTATLGPLGTAAGVLGGVIGKGAQFLTNRGANDESASLAEAAAYERTLEHTNGLNKLFSDGGTWKNNALKTTEILENSVGYAKGTGLDNYELIDLASQMQQYGTAKSANDAMAQAQTVARFSNNTGVDLGTAQKFFGTMRRYGASDDEALTYADKARQASGLEKGQTAEFLNSLESVIEDGIANGFVKSEKETAVTLSALYKLSGNNPLWTGAQGARRLQQMNSGVSNATAMQSTSQMLVIGAAKNLMDSAGNDKAKKALLGGENLTGTYIDTMRLVERGNDPKMFGEIARQVKAAEGDNVAGQIEQFKAIFGMNYTGATQVYEMAQKIGKDDYTEKDFAADIEKMKGSGQYDSEETKKQELINKIQTSVAQIHEKDFVETLRKLDALAVEKGNELLRLQKEKDEEKKDDVKPQPKPSNDYQVDNTPEAKKEISQAENLVKQGDFLGAGMLLRDNVFLRDMDYEGNGSIIPMLLDDKSGNENLDKLTIGYAAAESKGSPEAFATALNALRDTDILRAYRKADNGAITAAEYGKIIMQAMKEGIKEALENGTLHIE